MRHLTRRPTARPGHARRQHGEALGQFNANDVGSSAAGGGMTRPAKRAVRIRRGAYRPTRVAQLGAGLAGSQYGWLEHIAGLERFSYGLVGLLVIRRARVGG